MDDLPPFFAALPADEESLLNNAMQWLDDHVNEELTAGALAGLARRRGLDFTTAVLYCHTAMQPQYHRLVTDLVRIMQDQPSHTSIQATLAVAPGAFYRQIAKSGGDGRKVRQHAETLGFRTTLIPCESMGTLEQNGRIIRTWLLDRQQQYPDERIILSSLSKGAADIKTAMLQDTSAAAFKNVVAWINISGAPHGSPAVNWFKQRPIRWQLQNALFRLRGLDFEVIRQLEWGVSGLLQAEMAPIPSMKMLTVAGFPLAKHGSHFILRSYRRKMKAFGPSDGVALLSDIVTLPGDIVPVWGADHYMRPGWDVSQLIRATAVYLARELNLFAEA